MRPKSSHEQGSLDGTVSGVLLEATHAAPALNTDSKRSSVHDDGPVSSSTQRDAPPLVLLAHRSGGDLSGVHDYLERQAFRVRRAKSDPGAVELARRCHPDVVVLQADAANSGLQLMRQILDEVTVPVIIVAPRDHADPVAALERGADDYLVEPVALPEIAARARAAVRRSKRLPIRRVGALELDGRARHASTRHHRLSLTPSEYSILDFLARTPGQAVTHDDLVQAVGEFRANATARLGQRVRRLRSKLSAAGVDEPYITVVYGVGYRLDTR